MKHFALVFLGLFLASPSHAQELPSWLLSMAKNTIGTEETVRLLREREARLAEAPQKRVPEGAASAQEEGKKGSGE